MSRDPHPLIDEELPAFPNAPDQHPDPETRNPVSPPDGYREEMERIERLGLGENPLIDAIRAPTPRGQGGVHFLRIRD